MQRGDTVIIDTAAPNGGVMLLDASTRRVLLGPFRSVKEAVQAARALRPGCVIWHESRDGRGRALGAATRVDLLL